MQHICVRQGSNELDSALSSRKVQPCHPEPGPVILSAAKDLPAGRDRPFTSPRVTLCDLSNYQAQFIQIEPCLKNTKLLIASYHIGGLLHL